MSLNRKQPGADEVTALLFCSPGLCTRSFLRSSGTLVGSNTSHSVSPTLVLPAKSPGRPGTQVPRRWVSLDLSIQTKASQPQAALASDRHILALILTECPLAAGRGNKRIPDPLGFFHSLQVEDT